MNANDIKAAAADLASFGMVQGGMPGEWNVWISDVVDYLAGNHPEMSRDDIRAAIAAAPLTFARADLIGVLPAAKVAGSAIRTPRSTGGLAHYIVVLG